MTCWILSVGEGCDGSEWGLLGVYSSREKAEEARARYEARGHWAHTNEPFEQTVDEDMFGPG